jgi:hypothetical protein
MSENNDGYWLIWSNEHSGWWRPMSMGYTPKVEQAGQYSFSEALKICSGACYGNDWTKNQSRDGDIRFLAPNEVMVPSPEMIGTIKLREACAHAK